MEKTPKDSNQEERLACLETVVNTLIAALDKVPQEAADLILKKAQEQMQQQPQQPQQSGDAAAGAVANPLTNSAIAQLLPVLMQMGGSHEPDPFMELAKQKMLNSMELSNQLAQGQVQITQAVVKKILEGGKI